MNENNKYLVIKMLIETDGNKQRAAIILNCTVRHINRMIKGYKEKGKEYFLHGNRGRKPDHALDDNTRKMIVDLYLTKCFDANITHYSKLLKSQETINFSPSTIRTALLDAYILSPKTKKSTKKKLNNHLNQLKSKSNSTKEIKALQSAIIELKMRIQGILEVLM
ncbi:hypothetical protein ACLD43_01150 [Clostridium botulinum]|uniref:hypothetical protein n=1 Tax=Clostridium botulinum TaxID=1491 RepID=UPI003A80BA22